MFHYCSRLVPMLFFLHFFRGRKKINSPPKCNKKKRKDRKVAAVRYAVVCSMWVACVTNLLLVFVGEVPPMKDDGVFACIFPPLLELLTGTPMYSTVTYVANSVQRVT